VRPGFVDRERFAIRIEMARKIQLIRK